MEGRGGEAYARHRPQSEASAAAEGADPGGAGRPAPRDPAGGEQLGAEPEPARAGDTPLRGGASGGRRGRAALWSPAGGGRAAPANRRRRTVTAGALWAVWAALWLAYQLWALPALEAMYDKYDYSAAGWLLLCPALNLLLGMAVCALVSIWRELRPRRLASGVPCSGRGWAARPCFFWACCCCLCTGSCGPS